jgi:hypothetical protein
MNAWVGHFEHSQVLNKQTDKKQCKEKFRKDFIIKFEYYYFPFTSYLHFGEKRSDSCNCCNLQEYKELLESDTRHVLVDVRLPVEMDICHLPHPAISILHFYY